MYYIVTMLSQTIVNYINEKFVVLPQEIKLSCDENIKANSVVMFIDRLLNEYQVYSILDINYTFRIRNANELHYLIKTYKAPAKKECASEYYVVSCESCVFSNYYHISTLQLSSRVLWCLFNQHPIIQYTPSGVLRYLWCIQNDTITFVITSSSDEPLDTINQWNIMCSSNDPKVTEQFLKYIEKALFCYHSYYSGVEKGTFTSEIPLVNEAMQDIHSTMQSFAVSNQAFVKN